MNRINLSESELAALAARIQRNYDYDPERGLLVNKKTGRAVRGVARDKKNRYISFAFKHFGMVRFINYHAAVWVWHHGRFPKKQIDHVNGVETDNRIENLREVSGSENKLNMLHDWQPNRDTGLPGVCPHGRGYTNKIHGKNFHFRDPFEAFFHATLCGKLYKG
jgi:hypothetical protein